MPNKFLEEVKIFLEEDAPFYSKEGMEKFKNLIGLFKTAEIDEKVLQIIDSVETEMNRFYNVCYNKQLLDVEILRTNLYDYLEFLENSFDNIVNDVKNLVRIPLMKNRDKKDLVEALEYFLNKIKSVCQKSKKAFLNNIPTEVNNKSQAEQNLKKTKNFIKSIGIKNIGNTCYINSAVQQLYSMKTFRKEIMQSNPSQNKHETLYYMKEIFTSLKNRKIIPEKTLRDFTNLLGHSGKFGSSVDVLNKIIEKCETSLALLTTSQTKKLENKIPLVVEKTKSTVNEVIEHNYKQEWTGLNFLNVKGNEIILTFDDDTKGLEINETENLRLKKDDKNLTKCTLKSVILQAGGHYQIYKHRKSKNIWEYISDNERITEYTFADIKKKAETNNVNISSLVYKIG